jgi:hypothetical protein
VIKIFQSNVFNFLLKNGVENFMGISYIEIKEQFMKNLEQI